MSPAEKINAAFPVPTDVDAAHRRLMTLLSDNPKAADVARTQADSLMTLRALNCAKALSVGRTDSVATVKAMPIDRRCLQDQDKQLARYYGVRSIGVLLARPPLRPRSAVGALSVLPRGSLASIAYGTVARDANVAVMRDITGNGAVVELPNGSPIAQLPRAQTGEPGSRLSPNGQVAAINTMHTGTSFFEAETGNRVWETTDGTRVLTWLPELASFIYVTRDGMVMIADGQTGQVSPHQVAERNSSFVAYVPGNPARVLVGSSHVLRLVEHARVANGIQPNVVKELRITGGQGITSGNPVPMAAGKLVVFMSHPNIGWLNLEDGTSGMWKTAPYFGTQFAKLDETHLLITSVERNRLTTKNWSFDIAVGTVAPTDVPGNLGLTVDIGDRVGVMKRGQEAWFGDAVIVGDAAPMEQLNSAYELEVQLEKVRAQAETERLSAQSPTGARLGADPNAPSARVMAPGLGDVPRDAHVHMVGVYEGMRDAGSSARGSRSARTVRVVVRNSSKPVVLVLSSYEPVNWSVVNAGGRIAAVLLSGYHQSEVFGIGNTTVLRIGSAYAYAAGSPEYQRLRQAVTQYTGPMEIRSFQGKYAGSDFVVGGS